MTVAHTTLLNYLGKYITVDVPASVEYKESGFEQLSGVVVSVNFELDGKHCFCFEGSDYYCFDDVVIKPDSFLGITEDAECIRTDII